MTQAPSGQVTFLFTDIEGSTQLWEEAPSAMESALARHDELLRSAIESHGGHLFSKGGDSVCAAFAAGEDAVAAALDAQLALADDPWPAATPLRVRVALHTGTAIERDGDYLGPTLNRAARLLGSAHGGQILLSHTTEQLCHSRLPPQTTIKALGKHRLRDLSRSEHVYQLVHPQLRESFPALNSVDRFPNNLPVQLTSLIGRERELDRLAALLATHRLLTLTGVGGCGKTRLAMHLSADVLEEFPDGIWLVELAAVGDHELVDQTVASALGLQEEPSRSLIDTLVAHLENRSVLLVLDNCEHVIGAGAELAERLLRGCPNLRILATSREGLGIVGELVFPVPSLALPEADDTASTEEDIAALSRIEAVRLFVERAALASPGFSLTPGNAAAVCDICRRLDGIPLAIELAAARTRHLPVEQIRQRLVDRFRLLTGGSRTALPRQQNLRATMDWSHDLLGKREQRLFRRLAVFRGGWGIAAAEAVCADDEIQPAHVLDLLGGLVDKSLVSTEGEAGPARYGMLQTINQYATERLATSGQDQSVRRRHLQHYLTVAEEAAGELRGANQAQWLQTLEEEHDNLRAALVWATEVHDAERGLRLAGALWRYWHMHGYWAEGQRHLEAILTLPEADEHPALKAQAVRWRGNLVYAQGDLESARGLYEQSLALERELGDSGAIAACLNNLGVVVASQGDSEGARAFYEESLELLRSLDDRRGVSDTLNNLGGLAADQDDLEEARRLYEESLTISREEGNLQAVANSLNNLGEIRRARGDLDAAGQLYEESLACSRRLGDQRLEAMVLNNLGAVSREKGNLDTARELARQSLRIQQQLGHKLGLAYSLESFAQLAAAEGEPERAALLLGAAAALREEICSPLPPSDRKEIDAAIAANRDAMGHEAFEEHYAKGRRMAIDDAVARAIRDRPLTTR